MKAQTLGAVVALMAGILSLPVAAAPLVDLEAKAYYWQTAYSGKVGANNQVNTSDLGLDPKGNNSFSIRLEHPVPLLPNIKFQNTQLTNKGTGSLSVGDSFEIDGLNFANEKVSTKLDLSHRDLSLYYSFLWFDLGLTARSFNSDSSFTGATAGRKEIQLDGLVPLLYAGVAVDLPLTGLYANAELNTISAGGSSFRDIQAGIGYKFGSLVSLGTELGYRRMSVNLDEYDELDADLTVDGWYLSLGLLL